CCPFQVRAAQVGGCCSPCSAPAHRANEVRPAPPQSWWSGPGPGGPSPLATATRCTRLGRSTTRTESGPRRCLGTPAEGLTPNEEGLMNIIADQLASKLVVEQAVSALAWFAGLDLTRDQAHRLLRLWVRFPTLTLAEVNEVLSRFPVGAR